MKTCPCCLRPASPGLFEKMPECPYPDAILYSEKEDRRDFLAGHFTARAVFGRFFLQAEISLPLRRESSPILLHPWIEIPGDAVQGMRDTVEGRRRSFSGRANLAADIPGFPGSSGALCRIRCREGTLRILDCSDSRIAELSADLEHEEMAALYRLLWGNEDELDPPRWDLREESLLSYKEYLQGRRYTQSGIQPPPRLSGLESGEILLSPPLDTGKPAFLGTLGCSDVPDGEGAHYEIMSLLQNPSEDVVRCFSEFAYLSRMNPEASLLGQIVPERKPIPDSKDQMVAWLLVPSDEVDGSGNVQHLRAVPIQSVEMSFASAFGTESLWEVLQSSGEDLTSLLRRPSVEAIE